MPPTTMDTINVTGPCGKTSFHKLSLTNPFEDAATLEISITTPSADKNSFSLVDAGNNAVASLQLASNALGIMKLACYSNWR